MQHIAELTTFNVLQNAGAVLQPQIPVQPEEEPPEDELDEVLPEEDPPEEEIPEQSILLVMQPLPPQHSKILLPLGDTVSQLKR